MYNEVKTRIKLKPVAVIFILASISIIFRSAAASQVFGIKEVTLVS